MKLILNNVQCGIRAKSEVLEGFVMILANFSLFIMVIVGRTSQILLDFGQQILLSLAFVKVNDGD